MEEFGGKFYPNPTDESFAAEITDYFKTANDAHGLVEACRLLMQEQDRLRGPLQELQALTVSLHAALDRVNPDGYTVIENERIYRAAMKVIDAAIVEQSKKERQRDRAA